MVAFKGTVGNDDNTLLLSESELLGDDILSGDLGNDLLKGFDGDDTIEGGLGNDSIEGGAGKDRLFGQEGNDTVDGGDGDDTICGYEGDDVIYGRDGRDHIYGGEGNDIIYGGAGGDHLYGGEGADVFVFTPTTDLKNRDIDTIYDFDVNSDRIDLSAFNLNAYSTNTHAFDIFKNDSMPEVGLYQKGADVVITPKNTTNKGWVFLKNVNIDDLSAKNFIFAEAPKLNFEIRSLDGSGNNLLNPTLGRAGENYLRVGDANYVNGDEIDDTLPNARFISNRIFNDLHINLFSENNASHLVFVWGQFLDHTFGLATGVADAFGLDIRGGEEANIAFDKNDPLEDFRNDFGAIEVTRSAARGNGEQREQINTVSSFIDGWAIYGGTEARLEWLREGPVDGDMSNNSAKLLLPNGYLPTADARGDVANAPEMALMGRLRNDPASAIVAGDVRANENTGLTATHTLFAREHNRIVDLLPSYLDEETKFQITRKVVIAKQQYITYEEYLPSIGIELDPYQGYNPNVNPSLTNEFATVGYRAHSMVHGDFDFDRGNLSDADLAMLEQQGVLRDGGQIEVPVNAQSGNPSVVSKVGLGAVFEGLFETNYNNDYQIDNQLRSILFQVPIVSGEFTDGPPIEFLFNGVVDLGAIDVQRGRDHGMPSYNEMRIDYGLKPVTSFYEITGENPEAIKAFVDAADLKNVDGSKITSADLIFDANQLNLNDPSIIDFIAVFDEEGDLVADPEEIAKLLADNDEVEGVTAIQRSTVAARLEAIYGDIDNVDAFTGMVAEPHLAGTEFGELQYTIWKEQFEDLRDGDRFFYLNEPELASLNEIEATYGISYKDGLADIIANNTELDRGDIFANVFITEPHV
ncbi:peroxidase family protein [Myxosarcina sp. GI1]|uniref:peroxidase family protein n=1 Tax=Myxosarcina sp. GI1 TaxID=1541065 RepID=UPI00068AEBEE|nr:peroxidase family protein [Myxosarcina sp. GI1]